MFLGIVCLVKQCRPQSSVHVLTFVNNTNNCVKSLNHQKRYVRKNDRLNKCIYKLFRWNTITSERVTGEDMLGPVGATITSNS